MFLNTEEIETIKLAVVTKKNFDFHAQKMGNYENMNLKNIPTYFKIV